MSLNPDLETLYDIKPSIDWGRYRFYEKSRTTNSGIPFWSFRDTFKDAPVFEEIFEANYNRILRGE